MKLVDKIEITSDYVTYYQSSRLICEHVETIGEMQVLSDFIDAVEYDFQNEHWEVMWWTEVEWARLRKAVKAQKEFIQQLESWLNPN